MIRTLVKALSMYYFKPFAYKVATVCISSLSSLWTLSELQRKERDGWSQRRDTAEHPLVVPLLWFLPCTNMGPQPCTWWGTSPRWAFLALVHQLKNPASSLSNAWGSPPCLSSAGDGGKPWSGEMGKHSSDKSHCSEPESLWASQLSGQLNWFLPSPPVFSHFLGAALAFMQHDLIRCFWCSHRFHSSDLSPWSHLSAVSSSPDLCLTQKASLSQPSAVLAFPYISSPASSYFPNPPSVPQRDPRVGRSPPSRAPGATRQFGWPCVISCYFWRCSVMVLHGPTTPYPQRKPK